MYFLASELETEMATKTGKNVTDTNIFPYVSVETEVSVITRPKIVKNKIVNNTCFKYVYFSLYCIKNIQKMDAKKINAESDE